MRALVAFLRSAALAVEGPERAPTVRSSDPGDDHLIAPAVRERTLLVSGDDHLLELADRTPVVTAATFPARFVTPS